MLIHLALPEDFSSRLLGHHRFSSDTIKVAQKKKFSFFHELEGD